MDLKMKAKSLTPVKAESTLLLPLIQTSDSPRIILSNQVLLSQSLFSTPNDCCTQKTSTYTPRTQIDSESMHSVLSNSELNDSIIGSLKNSSSPLFQYPTVSQVLQDLPSTNPSDICRDLQSQVIQLRHALENEKAINKELHEQLIGMKVEIATMKEVINKQTDDILLKKLEIKNTNEQVNNLVKKHELNLSDLQTILSKRLQDAKKLESTVQELNIAKNELKNKVLQSEEKEIELKEVLYFRGQWNPLSTFYKCKLIPENGVGQGITFRTLEHLYQYRKLVAHDLHRDANRVRHVYSPSEAKRLGTRSLSKDKVTPKWLEDRLIVMTDLCMLKAQQCQIFKEALIATGASSLIHNIETDAEWGIGQDGKGANIMGKALEMVRTQLNDHRGKTDASTKPNIPSVDSATELEGASSTTMNTSFSRVAAESTIEGKTINTNKFENMNKKTLLVVSDSILQHVSSFIHIEGYETHAAYFPNAGIETIAEKAIFLCEQRKVDLLILHAGTHNLESDNFNYVKSQFQNVIHQLGWSSPNTTVLLSGIFLRLDKPWLNARVKAVNRFLQGLGMGNVQFVDHNDTIRNLNRILASDGMHLRASGLRLVSRNIRDAHIGISSTAQNPQWCLINHRT